MSALPFTAELSAVLNALYSVEQPSLLRGDFAPWSTPEDVAAALPAGFPHHGDAAWTRAQLEDLWAARKVLQIPGEEAVEPSAMRAVRLRGLDAHGDEDGRLRNETNDVREPADSEFAGVAIYDASTRVKYRSRVAEVGRLLQQNFQRFHMAPATGVIRYERRPQWRPVRDLVVADLSAQWAADIRRGELLLPVGEEGVTQPYPLRSAVQREELARATEAVLAALGERLARLASFQVTSILATLAGLYCDGYRESYDGQVVTASVGSGKSFAFQIGALIHIAHARLCGETGVRVLLLYPRVVLAANQFKELEEIVTRVGELLDVDLARPVLDAGGQLVRQFGSSEKEKEKGALFNAIKRAYGGNHSLFVSNLDTLANRLQHPEACSALVKNLDLIVCDEVHLLQGIYGSHARMLLKRLRLLRALWQLRGRHPDLHIAQLLKRVQQFPAPYVIGASATIAEPARHTGRLLATNENRIFAVPTGATEKTGWVHHFFLRQKPEVSTMTALINATSCLIHNRRDGLFREYYQPRGGEEVPRSLALDDLGNPVRRFHPGTVEPRDPSQIHKTLGFCDSLDGVGRWADLVADNERTKQGGEVSPNPGWDEYPYFTRFQEPLWRHVHQQSFAETTEVWQRELRQEYGKLCRDCKKGIRCSAPRVPENFQGTRRERVEELWSQKIVRGTPEGKEGFPRRSYLNHLGVGLEFATAGWLQPLRDASQAEVISNLDGCPFFQTGLCWWWSMDHTGSNVSAPPAFSTPLNGIKALQADDGYGKHHFVNGIRLQSFTSQHNANLMSLATINDIFRGPTREVLRDRVTYKSDTQENSALVIGSPRLEVGVDLSRVSDGITYRAMRDPSSLQQKVGRVGREPNSDSVLLHLVTQNTRDQYYFRNPQIALDPDFLQALPLHEDNRIVAQHHFWMATIDFLGLQGAEPGSGAIAAQGERIALINDHSRRMSFSGWVEKVRAVQEFLFGSHPNQPENLENLRAYLRLLGARSIEIENPAEAAGLTAAQAPRSRDVGVIDVLRHEFGPNFFLTPLPAARGPAVTLAQLCSLPSDPKLAIRPDQIAASFPRHAHFLQLIDAETDNAFLGRSYLWDLLTQPIFRRGLPAKNIPGNHPFVWTPNYFESIGTETVRIIDADAAGREKGYESVSAVLGLLVPGTVTYRYDAGASGPCKVPVSQKHALGTPEEVAPSVQAVQLNVDLPEYFEPADNCVAIDGSDLPRDFFGLGPIYIFTPRQLAVIRAQSDPHVTLDGMMADGDSRPSAILGSEPPAIRIMTPPRCYSLRWFRLELRSPEPVVSRLQREIEKYAQPSDKPLAVFPLPPVLASFSSIHFDRELSVTDFAWGLDRQFMSRAIDPARLVYKGPAGPEFTKQSVALGHCFTAPGLVFTLPTGAQSAVDQLFTEVWQHHESVVYQSLLWQVLNAFLSEHARLAPNPEATWLKGPQPSVFTLRNLRTIILFHLLRRWHPDADSNQRPATPPNFSFVQVANCFDENHADHLDKGTFADICEIVAHIHEAPSPEQHRDTLFKTWPYFAAACAEADKWNEAFFRDTALELLLNSLGIAMHEAALRQTGAEQENISYFYKRGETAAEMFLFDTDAFGNGTAELVRDNLVIPNAERTLAGKRRQIGHFVDPLPSKDFAHSLEEELQECASSQAAHLAYHAITPVSGGAWEGLRGECDGERRRAGALYDFLHVRLGIASFDETAALRECPEFLAYISQSYAVYNGYALVGSGDFPAYQALESACGYCLAGCVGCVTAPESNLHGNLNARESVNKTLLDAFYRRVIVESGTSEAAVCYPAAGPAHTCAWTDQWQTAAAGLAQHAGGATHLLVPKPGSSDVFAVSVSPAVTRESPAVVLRTGWTRVALPVELARVHMTF